MGVVILNRQREYVGTAVPIGTSPMLTAGFAYARGIYCTYSPFNEAKDAPSFLVPMNNEPGCRSLRVSVDDS